MFRGQRSSIQSESGPPIEEAFSGGHSSGHLLRRATERTLTVNIAACGGDLALAGNQC